mmetsp:Transcript_14314/g.19952  ORF Transcript_14314/g.19952 Transcript_14314/m.19952 type:complete len:134 (-) Transcript_14314:194-595(-)
MKFAAFGIVAFLAVIGSVTAEDVGAAMRKERIKKMRDLQSRSPEFTATQAERQEKRMSKLAEMLEDRKSQLEEHVSGRKLMNSEDHARVTRQVKNFQMKLDQFHAMTQDDKNQLLREELEAMRDMHTIDHINM